MLLDAADTVLQLIKQKFKFRVDDESKNKKTFCKSYIKVKQHILLDASDAAVCCIVCVLTCIEIRLIPQCLPAGRHQLLL